MKKLFLDASVLMEIMFGRSKLDLISGILHNPDYEFSISVLTTHILYYFAESKGLDRDFVKKLIDLAKQLPLNESTVLLAQQRYNNKDFEDCLQAACAELNGCDEILSLDKNFEKYSGTKLRVLTF